jgi:hypothetical protein
MVARTHLNVGTSIPALPVLHPFTLFQARGSKKTVVPKGCSSDPKGSATNSQETRGYIPVVATLEFINYF